MAAKKSDMDLITAVVRQSLAETAMDAAQKAGASGITFFAASGTGVRQTLGLAGRLVEAEKQVLWVVTPASETKKVLDAIVAAANLNLPGEGFAYVQPVSQAVGFIAAAA